MVDYLKRNNKASDKLMTRRKECKKNERITKPENNF